MSIATSGRSGVLAGGNWIVDHVKIIDSWPPQDALVNILSETWGNGGSPYNILKDLARLGAAFPLEAVGLVGDDVDGERIVADCRSHGIDTTQLRQLTGVATSYTDVMTVGATGRRTFFHLHGANAVLDPGHFDFSKTRAKIFHLGYLLLLDRLDRIDGGRPRASDVFSRARAMGLLTSVDCVSENSDRFRNVVKPVLPDVDFLFVNDFEAERITGISLRSDPAGVIGRAAVERVARALIDMGVRQWVLLHFPEAAFALHSNGEACWQPSLQVPASSIKGSAGAGDAFASGVIYGLHEDWTMPDALRLGVCVAASSLFDATCSKGILKIADSLRLASELGFRPLPA